MVVRIHNCTVLHTSARRTRNDVRPNVLWRGFYWSLGAYFAFFLLRGFLRFDFGIIAQLQVLFHPVRLGLALKESFPHIWRCGMVNVSRIVVL
jgi:hypothetical protein